MPNRTVEKRVKKELATTVYMIHYYYYYFKLKYILLHVYRKIRKSVV